MVLCNDTGCYVGLQYQSKKCYVHLHLHMVDILHCDTDNTSLMICRVSTHYPLYVGTLSTVFFLLAVFITVAISFVTYGTYNRIDIGHIA